MGFELIDLLEEYYSLMAGIKNKNKNKNKKQKIKNEIEDSVLEKEKTKILLTEKITTVMISNKVQQFILNENLEEK